MKNLLTILLLLAGSTAFATNANESLNNKSTVTSNTTAETANAAMLNQLQVENKMLKARMEMLEQLNEENNSIINYQQTMNAVVKGLQQVRHEQTVEELNARLNYERLMSNTLLNLSRK
jgi:hypothetical protein